MIYGSDELTTKTCWPPYFSFIQECWKPCASFFLEFIEDLATSFCQIFLICISKPTWTFLVYFFTGKQAFSRSLLVISLVNEMAAMCLLNQMILSGDKGWNKFESTLTKLSLNNHCNASWRWHFSVSSDWIMCFNLLTSHPASHCHLSIIQIKQVRFKAKVQ